MFNITDINSQTKYNKAVNKMSSFFRERGFIEIHGQSHLSILAACEDPTTIGSFNYSGSVWPLPQTNQMNLEWILLKNPDLPGVFCQTTSYRQEANPVPGRHDLIFPMFEFEAKGDEKDLINLEKELLNYLGFDIYDYVQDEYLNIAHRLNVKEINDDEETYIWENISPVFFLTKFPEYTSPFWNMKRENELSNKVDVILFGIETIGSAEREIDPNIMFERFNSISDGKYAELLFAHFGRARVLKELGEFLDLDFVPRFGAGIGMTRMIRALDLLEKESK